MKIEHPGFNYNAHGHTYAGFRQADNRISKYIHDALGEARTVLNVGAGAGSYEPMDRHVVALEPSQVMRAQRPGQHVPALIGKAESLPFDDRSFDASMAMLTVHHWLYMKKGLRELRRVTREQILILTFDPDELKNFWIADYAPELIEVEKLRYPTIDFLVTALKGRAEVIRIPVPFDCTDGFQEAFYGRPEAFLEPGVRKSQSAWGFLAKGVEEEIVARLRKDLDSGVWDKRYGHFRMQKEFMGALKLIIASRD
ncbi:MAG: class I SAM-dependent methyltransferase [Bacteroidia bacterium]